MIKPTFHIDTAIKALSEDKDLSSKDGILIPLIKQLTEAAMEKAMEKQAAAERQRRATVTRAEGGKQAAILEAYGRLEASRSKPISTISCAHSPLIRCDK